ncbi:hypothetical protein ABZ904_42285 [Streptomyces sp. NPDC046900]|uniref:hypothetical protein n=1 Tax=Streptomyces sp. NPDC046900 TaxID=3155473 RepID=UPI0034107F80
MANPQQHLVQLSHPHIWAHIILRDQNNGDRGLPVTNSRHITPHQLATLRNSGGAEPGDTLGAEPGDGGVDGAHRPEHDGVGDQAERTALVLSEPAQHGGKFAATPTTTRGTDEMKFPG